MPKKGCWKHKAMVGLRKTLPQDVVGIHGFLFNSKLPENRQPLDVVGERVFSKILFLLKSYKKDDWKIKDLSLGKKESSDKNNSSDCMSGVLSLKIKGVECVVNYDFCASGNVEQIIFMLGDKIENRELVIIEKYECENDTSEKDCYELIEKNVISMLDDLPSVDIEEARNEPIKCAEALIEKFKKQAGVS